ncbi:HDOD domain-containing protein [Ferriphaselus sp. R-1]|uniref:HDOD domain-containing protein n=1 Tax=Ferriphaselus sp. R-1 TaxID=1485544 RepID=UPI00054F5D6B|nr:HDOD domain-containing protein [Ferriphaselus sp. R-1]
MGNKLESVFGEVLVAIERDELSFPVFPECANRVRTLINDPDVSAQQVVAAISGDIGISAHLIKAANSAVFADKPKVEHLRQAVSRLGYKQVHNLVLLVTLSELLHTQHPVISRYLRDFWCRNREVAAFSFVLAQSNRQINPEQAMLAGLLHNIGALPICLYVDRPGFELDIEELYELIDRLQVQVAAKLLAVWRFPDAVIAAVTGGAAADGPVHYADLVKLASLLSQPLVKDIDWGNVKAAQRLGMDEHACRSFALDHQVQLTQARALLGIESANPAPPAPPVAAQPIPQVIRPVRAPVRVEPVSKPGFFAAILRFFGLG